MIDNPPTTSALAPNGLNVQTANKFTLVFLGKDLTAIYVEDLPSGATVIATAPDGCVYQAVYTLVEDKYYTVSSEDHHSLDEALAGLEGLVPEGDWYCPQTLGC
jgi:hypothetical protein